MKHGRRIILIILIILIISDYFNLFLIIPSRYWVKYALVMPTCNVFMPSPHIQGVRKYVCALIVG